MASARALSILYLPSLIATTQPLLRFLITVMDSPLKQPRENKKELSSSSSVSIALMMYSFPSSAVRNVIALPPEIMELASANTQIIAPKFPFVNSFLEIFEKFYIIAI